MHAALSADVDSFITNALDRVPAALCDQALEIGEGSVSAAFGERFRSVQMIRQQGLSELPIGQFQFILAVRSFDEITSHAPVILSMREATRLLREGGLLCVRLNNLPDSPVRFSMGELAEAARDFDFQILAMEGAGSKAMWLLWRKRAAGWRASLADHAALASARIVRVMNSWDHGPVVPSRGRYAATTICVDGLPIDMDLLDLEVFIGGVRATATFIGEPGPQGLQEIHAILPNLEQTGLLRVELRWFGELITTGAAYVRVIPPGPVVPRIARVASGSSRLAGITVSIEELARPDELLATIDGRPVWGLEAFCTDPGAQSYEVRFQLPDEIPAGIHEIRMSVGRRKLPPIAVEIA